MYHRIMIPIDDSDAASAAFAHALQLAKLTQGQLALVHVTNTVQPLDPVIVELRDSDGYRELVNRNEIASKQALDKLAMQASDAGVACEAMDLNHWGSNPVGTLVKAAGDWKAELIVVGTHGYSYFQRLIYGSVADNLMHHTTIPVLLIHPEKP